jgi:hypothetical protein
MRSFLSGSIHLSMASADHESENEYVAHEVHSQCALFVPDIAVA